MERKPYITDRRRPKRFTHVLGALLLDIALVLGCLIVYEAFWTNIEANELQEEVTKDLEEKWSVPSEQGSSDPIVQRPPIEGEGFARMYVPKFGKDWEYTIVEGTSLDSLRYGPGHYPMSQGLGEDGNFAIAGHRAGNGEPFDPIDTLDVCDTIVLETRTDWVTYKVLPMAVDGPTREVQAGECFGDEQVAKITDGDYSHVVGSRITVPEDVAVIDPIPHLDRDVKASEKLLTLTACHPRFSNAQRIIIHLMETGTVDKSTTPVPEELTGVVS